jgi:hypothetical protein
MPGGTMTSVPIVIEGDRLVLNMSTSTAGCVTVELLDEAGAPISGFAAADCDEVFGEPKHSIEHFSVYIRKEEHKRSTQPLSNP